MKDEKYINIAIDTFRTLQKKHELKLVIKDTILNYSNNLCNFSVYFEKHFEFYICFHLNHIDMRLCDIAGWLGFERCDVDLLTKNQIANEHDAKFVLGNLLIVLEKILDMLKNKPNLLNEFSEYQKRKKKNLLLEPNLSFIQKAWKAKKFEEFLRLVDLNRAAIEQSKNAKIIFKQEAYIRRLRGQGDGLRLDELNPE